MRRKLLRTYCMFVALVSGLDYYHKIAVCDHVYEIMLKLWSCKNSGVCDTRGQIPKSIYQASNGKHSEIRRNIH